MRFYCWEHSKDFFHTGRPGRVRCEVGPHDIGRAFPFADLWEQCAYCETVWHARLKGEYHPAPACPTCEKGAEGLAALALCEHCGTFRLVSPEAIVTEVFKEAADDGTAPKAPPQELAVCRACSLPQSRPARAHYCLSIGRPFRTARTSCPFECGTGFFPNTLAEYAAAVPEGLRHPAWLDALEVTEIRLTQSPQSATLTEQSAHFVLGPNGTADMSLVLPQCATFEECQALAAVYRQLFDYGVGLSGELCVLKPAVVERVGGGWRLRERGALAEMEPPPATPEPQEEVMSPAEGGEVTGAGTAAPSAEPGASPPEPEAASTPDGEPEVAAAFEPKSRQHDSLPEESVPHADDPTPPRPFDLTSPTLLLGLAISAVGVLFLLFVVWRLAPGGGGNTNGVRPTPAPTRAADPELPLGMVFVRGGKFVMGRAGGDLYETPTHEVNVSPFFLDKQEVTREQYARFVKEMRYRPPQGWQGDNYSGEGNLPVTGVSWEDANAYAAWRSRKEGGVYRLPTEEEWEFAARGGDGRTYPWGNEWRERVANAGRTGQATGGVAVGCKYNGLSPLGVCDMAGNAWEWTADPLRAYPGGHLPSDGLTAEQRGMLRVIRGGCYLSDPQAASTTYRRGWPAAGADYAQTGFRCARDAGPQEANQKR